MRTSNVIINGVDIFSTYGAIIAKDGYKELIQWPAMKAVSGNDWQEEDGFEPDLSDPRLDSREMTITFGCSGGASKVMVFYNFLLTQPVMTYSFGNIERSVDLRVVSMPTPEYAVRFEIIPVRFACDNPLAGYSYTAPSSTLVENRQYVIDGTPLSAYGVRTLYGTIDGTMKRPDVKPLLTRNNSVIDGAEYDQNPIIYDAGSTSWKRRISSGTVTTRARDITLHCQLTAPSLSNAWRNYDALLYNLTKKDESASDETLAGAHEILIRALGGSYRFYYKQQQVLDYHFASGHVWIEFNLTLTLFQVLAESGGDDGGGGGGDDTQLFFLLASEDNGFVITEDGRLIPLDIN